MKNLQGEFVWHDLLTSEVGQSLAFYGKAVGLNFNEDASGYQTAMAQGFEMGGIMKAPDYLEKMPPFWSGYISAPSAEAACQAVARHGGVIFREPWGIGGLLRMAVVADPTGGFFNILEGTSDQQHPPLPPRGAVGSVGWNELHTDDCEVALDFYCSLFGWTRGGTRELDGGGLCHMFKIRGKIAGGMRQRAPAMKRPMWRYYFVTNDLDAAVDCITEEGGRPDTSAFELANGQWGLPATDPQGGSFQLMSAKRPSAVPS